MDQYLNNRQNEILWNLVADPANNGHSFVSNLQSLVTDFPQSGLLHALLAHAEGGGNISHAAAYVNPKALYTLINYPDSLAGVSQGQIIQVLDGRAHYGAGSVDGGLFAEEEGVQLNNFEPGHVPAVSELSEPEAIAEIIERINIVEPEPAEAQLAGPDAHSEREAISGIIESITSTDEQGPGQAELSGPEAYSEPENLPTMAESALYVHLHDAEASEDLELTERAYSQQVQPLEMDSTEPLTRAVYQDPDIEVEMIEYGPLGDFSSPAVAGMEEKSAAAPSVDDFHQGEKLTETENFALSELPHSIEDEVFDEIVGIESISFAPVVRPVETVIPDIELPIMDEEASQLLTPRPDAQPKVQKERALNLDDEAEKLIVGNIAATDYFVFDRAVNERKPVEIAGGESAASNDEPAGQTAAPAAETNDVSKYDDDTLPYTFLWWLNKTRREHAGIYQPFKLDTTQAIRQQGADELQQQYYENIFHLSSVEELDRSTVEPAIEFDTKRKEDRIIKKFIIEEPHISTPSSDKLDNENKAKKSAEDQDELVTETLARIYTDQMLYHKAINTYKKLILKFPEKSRYFADQIEQLERKTN